ncbi:isoprenyl transferase [Glycocaulis alkaliphilus]|nr:isoprenyl transferase [Glycocaulis alkaliphilus]
MSAEPGGQIPVPRHVAVIMDGNGRWASARGLPRAMGHRQGVEAVRALVRGSADLGVTHLTLFGFSTENWRRSSEEVSTLFDLLKQFVDADLDDLARNGVRVRILGSRQGLSRDILDIIDRAEARTASNSRFNLNVAFNYGGRDEIVRTAKALLAEAQAGALQGEIDEKAFAARLDTSGLPDPDMIIRTSGEMRISNFLLWQGAYSELVFMDVLWPDFSVDHMKEAIAIYQARNRRFGGRP